MRKLFTMILFLLFTFQMFGQGTETFDNFDATGSSYVNGTFLGQDGSTWTYTQARGDYEITGKALMIGRNRSPQSEVYSGSIAGGVGVISFNYMQAFSSNVNLNLYVNDVLYGNVTTTGEQSIIKPSGDITVNVPGNVVIKLINANNSDGQVVVDDITWTGYTGGGEDMPPIIGTITRSVKVPLETEDLTITAEITDDNEVTSALLHYSINGGETVDVTMNLNTNYSGIIPNSAFGDGDILTYWVSASDGVNDEVLSSLTSLFAGTTDIEILKTVDDNGAAVYDGFYARATGISLADGETYDPVGNTFGYLMGSTAAINVYYNGAVYPFVEGNSYTVVGQIDQYNGLIEIIPDDVNTDITDNGVAGQVQPLVLTLAELLENPEAYESMLVGIVGVTKTDGTWPAEGSNANLTISDDGGTTTVTLRIDKDTDIDGTTEPTWPKDVVGIFIQFDSSSPFDGGYQLLPRSTADILENGTIPVELVSFSATALDNKVKLEWTTATETNNSGFEIQKSTENSSWEKVSFVEGRGTSTEINSYVYVDNKVSAGKYSYRLKQIDFDGTVSYSSVIEVVVGVPVEYELAQNFPNPFNPTTNIRFSLPEQANVNLTVYNVLGQEVATVVNESLEAGIHNYAFDASNLNSGVYYYRIKTDNFVEVKKMMLVK